MKKHLIAFGILSLIILPNSATFADGKLIGTSGSTAVDQSLEGAVSYNGFRCPGSNIDLEIDSASWSISDYSAQELCGSAFTAPGDICTSNKDSGVQWIKNHVKRVTCSIDEYQATTTAELSNGVLNVVVSPDQDISQAVAAIYLQSLYDADHK